MPELTWLGAAEIDDLLALDDVVDSQRAAFAALSDGTGQLAPRLLLPRESDGSVVFCYAARLSPSTAPVCKFGSVVPANRDRGLPSVSALVVALDPETGQPLGLFDGEAVTTARTSAASALAARLLVREDARTLTILGTGVQGLAHLRSLAGVRPWEEVRLWSPSVDRRREAIMQVAQEVGVPVRSVADARAAVQGSDLVVTTTTSTTPVLEASWLATGATVLSVGSITPDRCEIGDDVLARASRVVVDHPETAAQQAGPVVHALDTGLLTAADLVGLGDVVTGRATGRRDGQELVVYNSVGVGIQDAAVVALLLERGAADR